MKKQIKAPNFMEHFLKCIHLILNYRPKSSALRKLQQTLVNFLIKKYA